MPAAGANDGQREGGLGLALGHDDDDDEISVHKKDMMKVFLPVALSAAVASVGYLVNVVRMNAKHGVSDLLYKLVFDDVWASIAITVLCLYTNFAQTAVSLTFTTASNFIRPTRVNMLWWVSLFIQLIHHARDYDDQGDARVESGESRMVVDSARNRSHQS